MFVSQCIFASRFAVFMEMRLGLLTYVFDNGSRMFSFIFSILV